MLRRRAGQGAEREKTGLTKRPAKKRGGGYAADMLKSRGFWKDWTSMRWIVIPCGSERGGSEEQRRSLNLPTASQLPVLLFPIIMYWNHRLLTSEHVMPSLAQDLFGRKSIVDPSVPNIFAPFLFVSNPSPPGAEAMELAKNAARGHVGSNGAGVGGQTYMRSWLDILFVLYHIVAFSLWVEAAMESVTPAQPARNAASAKPSRSTSCARSCGDWAFVAARWCGHSQFRA